MNDCYRCVGDALGRGENKQESGIEANRGSQDSMLKCGLLTSIIEIESSLEKEGRRGRWK